jgi:hypothetical protein
MHHVMRTHVLAKLNSVSAAKINLDNVGFVRVGEKANHVVVK